MNRRKFLELTNTIVLGATGAALLPLATLTTRRTPYVDEIDPNYRALRERIIELAKAGHEVERWELRVASRRLSFRPGVHEERPFANVAPTVVRGKCMKVIVAEP